MQIRPASNYDSEFCGSLPIHLINVIQPYGALLVASRPEKEIIQVSENTGELTGIPHTALIGSRLEEHVRLLDFSASKNKEPQVCEIAGVKYLAIVHEKPAYYLIEINLDSRDEALGTSFIDLYKDLKNAIARIEAAQSLHEAVRITAAELREASGFDKVMIYRFDENWNGHVLAEEKEEDMESYLNFTFPASDIPRQARELYLRNPYRFIPDRDFAPVKLYPVVNPKVSAFLDLSDCNVRGVSTVHIEYLRNMNVTASMSTRIIKDGALWGLIACHHKTPKQVNYKMCAIFEFLSGIVSSKISALENREIHQLNARLQERYTALIEEIYRSANIIDSLLLNNSNLLGLFDTTGAVIVYKGDSFSRGTVPDPAEIEDILLWLDTKELGGVYHTDSLSSEFDYARDIRDIASGLLAIPINTAKEEYILLFRPEITRVVNWGGDPSTRINFEEDMKTYHPRFSFKLWQEKVRGVSALWRPEELEAAENLRVFLNGFLVNQ